MWTGFERRVTEGGHIQVPGNLRGRTVLVMFDTDGPVCGDAIRPHVGHPCLNCGAPSDSEAGGESRAD